MYIEKVPSYYKGGNQYDPKGLFLILCQPPGMEGCNYPIRAFVRKVALEQLGNFMMGKVKIHGKVFSVSGAYGHDGLPMSVPMEIYEKGILVPPHLVEKWKNGGGWNSCGSEAEGMRKWANTIKYQSLGIITHIKSPQTLWYKALPVCHQLAMNMVFEEIGKATCKNCQKYLPIRYPEMMERCRGGVGEVLEILDKELNK